MPSHPAHKPAQPLRLIGAAMIAASIACAAEGAGDADSAAGTVGSADPARRVRIVSPADGDTVGAEVRVTLDVSDIMIEVANNLREEGRGHHHLLLDTTLTALDAPIPPNTTAGPSGQIVHLGTGVSEYTFTNLTPGPHRLIAVVGYGNHVPMADATTDTVTIVVRRP